MLRVSVTVGVNISKYFTNKLQENSKFVYVTGKKYENVHVAITKFYHDGHFKSSPSVMKNI